MKTTMLKRTLVLFLAVLIAFTSLPLALAEDVPGDAGLSLTETAEGTNPLAAAVADAVNERTEGDETTYSILGMDLDGFTASVTCYAPAGSTMVAAMYDEDTTQMLTSGSVKLEEEAELVNVEMAECDLPEYYYVKVFLLAEDNTALAESFTYSRHTKRMEEFYAITPEDFDKDHVVLFGNDDNFAAVNQAAKIIRHSETANNVTVVDYENSEYTFINPDATMKTLKKGDIFYYEIEDALIVGTIVKIATNKDGSVTIFTDPDENPATLFEYIHVDTTKQTQELTKRNATRNAKAPDYDDGKEKHISKEVEISFSSPQKPTKIFFPDDWSEKGVDNASLTVENKSNAKIEVLFAGKLKAEVDLEYCYHIKWGPDDYYLNMDITTTLSGSVSIYASAKAKVSINLLKFDLPTSIPGLSIYVQAVFSLGVDGKISATGTIKAIDTYYYQKARKNGNSTNISEGGKPKFEISFDVELSVTVTAELKVAAGAEIAFGAVKVGAYAKLTAKASVKPLALCISNEKISAALSTKDWSYYTDGEIHAQHDCSLCFSADVTIDLSLGIEVDWFLKKRDSTWTHPTGTLTFDIVELEKELDASAELFKWTLLAKKLRASKANGDWEFEWMDKDVACPHMRFLTMIIVKDKEDKAFKDFPITIKAAKGQKNSAYSSVPDTTTLKTDGNGVAKCYLPPAKYGFDASNDSMKIISSEPDNKEFQIKNDSLSFFSVGNKSKSFTVSVVRDSSGEPVPEAEIEIRSTFLQWLFGSPKKYTSDDNGNATINLFPEEEVTFTVTTKDGITETIKKTIPTDTTKLELRMTVQKCKIVGTVVDETTGVAIPGISVDVEEIIASGLSADPETLATTNKSGQFELYLATGTYNFSFTGVEYETVSNKSIVISSDTDIGTIQLKKSGNTDPIAGKIIASGKCGENGDNVTWTLDDKGMLTISGSGNMRNYPAYDSPWQQKENSIKRIIIKEGPTSIGEHAFSGCNYLTDVTIPNSVVSIKARAFMGCNSLASITIPDSVTSIGDNAFIHTPWYDNQPDGLVYAGKVAYKYKGLMQDNTNLVLEDGTKGIAGSAFYNNKTLASITIPNSVMSVGEEAFKYCSSLTSVKTPESVTSIMYSIFENGSKQTPPDSSLSIGYAAFGYCSSLASVTIPNSVKIIGDYAFEDCYGLTSVTIPNSVTSIGDSAFSECYELTNVTIPNSVISIGAWAFESCRNLTNVTIPDSVVNIGEKGTFSGCHSLAKITIGNNVTCIGDWAFRGCGNLTDVTIGNSVTSIGEDAFWNCRSMTNVTIPNSVTSIGDSAFGFCSNITKVTIGNNVTSVGDSAFCSCSSLTDVTIPNSVISIGDSAFEFCSNMTEVTIGNSVTSIGFGAFSGCPIKNIYYTGTSEQWQIININNDNDALKGNVIYNYTPSSVKQSALAKASRFASFLRNAALSAQTANRTDTVNGEEYVLLVVKDANAEKLLAADNLLYIDQQTAESETVTFTYVPREDFSGATATIYGADKDNHVHKFGEWTVTKPATAAEEGVETRVCTVCGYAETRTVAKTEQTFAPGDVNGDNKVGSDDARLALRASVGLEQYAEGSAEFLAADVNKDNKIGSDDARLILRASVGLEDPKTWIK